MNATIQQTLATPAGRLRVPKGLPVEQRAVYERIPDEVRYVPHPSFRTLSAEEKLFGEDAPRIDVPQWTQFADVPEELSSGRRAGKGRRSLRPAEEAVLFLRYNYALYRLARLVKAQKRRVCLPRARQMVTWFCRAGRCRADLVRANMPLVLAMAKRTRVPNVEFAELVSEGNMALLRAVDKFDVARGYKFSTYACRAILKSFNRLATKTGRYRQHFPTEFDPDMERSDYDVKKHQMQHDDSVDALREILARNTAGLSDVERRIVMERFAIGSAGRGRTLAEVGQMVGLTNERVRQIQNLALAKIRNVMDDLYLVA